MRNGPERLVMLPGAHRRRVGTRLLADALRREGPGPNKRVVETGTGAGALAPSATEPDGVHGAGS
ncbi:hypothetical protein ABZ957_07725 [Streptomyces sp. NPDC046316]|uniref:hypothetical protein n=1 Tax=Streptomyces sp. NPDC046316 TaxID=3154494 RepID=UPI0033F3067E